VSQYLKGQTNLDFTEARDSEWQWHQLGHKQVCTSLQTDNDTSIPPLSFLQAISQRKQTKTNLQVTHLDIIYTGALVHSHVLYS